MNAYQHYLSGFFATRGDAERALERLLRKGVPRERLHLFEAGSLPPETAPKEDSNAVLKDVLVDTTKGAAIGTGLGALAQVALVAGNVSLFIASPLVAPLMLLGWGASLGGLIGGAAGAVSRTAPGEEKKEGMLSALVRDAIASGQYVLVTDARTEGETAAVRQVLTDVVGDYRDDSA